MIRPLVPKTRYDTAYWRFRPYFLRLRSRHCLLLLGNLFVVNTLDLDEYLLVGWSDSSGCVMLSFPNCNKPFHSQPLLKFARRAWWFAECISTLNLGLKMRRVFTAKHDVAVACRRFVERWWSCWLKRRVHLRCNRSVVAGRKQVQCRARWGRKHKQCP